MNIATVRTALKKAAVLLGIFWLTAGLVTTVNAQARTPEEQAANRTYHQLDAAYSQATRRASTSPTSSASAPLSGPTSPSTATAQNTARPSCRKHFRIDGTDQILSLVKHFYDFNSAELDGWKKQWKENYQAGGYTEMPGTHTKQQDCAGYVMDQLWRTGRVWVTGELLYEKVIKKHGRKRTSWSDVEINDIVVWGEKGRHVAIVKYIDAFSIIIETKDGVEPVYRTNLRLAGPYDPLFTNYGSTHVWQVDPRRVKITPVSNEDCDPDPSGDGQVERIVAALNSLPYCPGRQLGPACFQKYPVHKDGLVATTFLAREPPAGSERIDVQVTAWTDQASASRSFKSTFDSLKGRKMGEHQASETFAATGKPDTGALTVWLDSYFGGEPREAGKAYGTFICGKVVGGLDMFISAGGSTRGKALVDATKAQMKGVLQQIGNAVRASGACP